MNEDVLRILKMVEDGKIDADKAAGLIAALKDVDEPKDFIQTKKIDNSGKMLRVRVISGENDKVNVNLPIDFIKTVLGAVGRIPIGVNGLEGIDTAVIAEAINSGIEGKIVDVTSANGDIVEVYIE